MKLRIIILILSLLSFLSTGLGGYLYYSTHSKSLYHRAHAEAALRARTVATRIDTALAEHQKSVKAMAVLVRLAAVLESPGPENVAEANRVLDHFRRTLEVEVCYLLDSKGTTVATSNWNEPDSFLYKNYRFRPYFLEALEGRTSTYMALGVTSGRRGIYFSFPVHGPERRAVKGVVVIKAGTEAVEREFGDAPEGEMLFATPQGVVFLSSRADWLYRTVWPLTDSERAALAASKQFGGGPFTWIGLEFDEESGRAVDRQGKRYQVHSATVPSAPGWQVLYLHDLDFIGRQSTMLLMRVTGYVVFGVVLLTGGAVLVLYRLASGDIERRRAAEEALAEAHRDLAQRVEERTADLRESNQQLLAEVEARQRAENALVSAKEHLQAIYDASPDMIFVHTADGTIVDVNQNMLDMYGYERQEVIGILPSALSGEGNTPEMARERIAMTLAGREQSFEWVARRKSGEEFPVEVRLRPLDLASGNGGREPGVLAVVRDISERRRIEEHLRHSQKIEAVGKLAGGIAHDFNNILMAIMGYAEILRDDMPEGSRQRGAVDQILASSARAAHLTRGLLAFSRKQMIDPRPVELNGILIEVDRLLGRLIREDIRIETVLCREPVVVLVDIGQLEQVLMNLATNARDAMPEGGSLRLTTGKAYLGEDFFLSHGLGRPGQYAVLTVTDTGHGMDEETRRRVFEPFFTTKEVGKGTGLGLAMVYGIVKQHNGFIDVASQPGQGTTVTIYLPLAEKEVAAEPRPAAAEAAPVGGNEAILLAEDDQTLRTLMASTLRSYGYRVIEAEDGAAALARFEECRELEPLLLLDVIMPKKSGQLVWEEIRRQEPEARVIFVSGYAADILKDKGITTGGADVLVKPVAPRVLLAKVREVLDRPALGASR